MRDARHAVNQAIDQRLGKLDARIDNRLKDKLAELDERSPFALRDRRVYEQLGDLDLTITQIGEENPRPIP